MAKQQSVFWNPPASCVGHKLRIGTSDKGKAIYAKVGQKLTGVLSEETLDRLQDAVPANWLRIETVASAPAGGPPSGQRKARGGDDDPAAPAAPAAPTPN